MWIKYALFQTFFLFLAYLGSAIIVQEFFLWFLVVIAIFCIPFCNLKLPIFFYFERNNSCYTNKWDNVDVLFKMGVTHWGYNPFGSYQTEFLSRLRWHIGSFEFKLRPFFKIIIKQVKRRSLIEEEKLQKGILSLKWLLFVAKITQLILYKNISSSVS